MDVVDVESAKPVPDEGVETRLRHEQAKSLCCRGEPLGNPYAEPAEILEHLAEGGVSFLRLELRSPQPGLAQTLDVVHHCNPLFQSARSVLATRLDSPG